MIPNINILLTINTETILLILLPIIAIAITFFIVPLGIATMIATLKVIISKEYEYTTQSICLITNILLLTFYVIFLTFIILNTANLPEIQ